jgi:hypothetical protein
MIPIPDLVALAGARNAKMVLAGDTGQLQAVENGGAMSLLAVALGYLLLADRAAPTAPRCSYHCGRNKQPSPGRWPGLPVT